MAREQERINRFAEIIATVRISGQPPEDITTKEFNEIAMWDEVGNRVGIILAQHQPRAVGTVNLSDLVGEDK